DFHFGPYHLKVRGAPFLAQPWSLEVENRMVGISDSHPANSGARSADERDRHVAWCLASCLVAYRVAKRDLDGSDAMEVSQVHDAVLRYVFGSPDAPQAAPSPLTTSAAPAKSAGRRLTGPRPAVR
ncbi:MAG: hypothetical protein Q8R16_02140, partial [bacterium]|nr:hypothetical protein [bacterium]